MKSYRTFTILCGLAAALLVSASNFAQAYSPSRAMIASAGTTRSESGIPEDLTKNFTVLKGELLSVNVTGDVTVTSWKKNEVQVTVTGLDDDELKEVVLSYKEGTVFVTFLSRGNSNSDVAFNISVPEEFNISVKTSGGEVVCKGQFIGSLSGKTAGGNITIGDVTGKVEMKTSGGEILIGNTKGDIDLGTSGGNVTTGNIDGEGKIRTSGGEIIVKNVSKSLNVSTNGGDISVGVIAGDLKAATSGGNISVSSVGGICKLSTSGGDIRVQKSNGRVTANTSGGDLKLTGLSGSVNANTSGGTVYAEMLSEGDDDSKLTSSGGKITLLIAENAKADIDAAISLGTPNKNRKVKISSDFKADSITENSDEYEMKASYALNGGGKRIKLRTYNSDIVIKKLTK